MGAGSLDRRIVIQRAAGTTSALNSMVKVWSAYTTVWAARRDISDSEKVAGGHVMASLASRFVIRSSSVSRAIRSTDRISYDGSIWNIHGIKETAEGRARFLEITAVRAAD